jgi:integrase
MARIGKVSLYHRDNKGYHLCDPRGVYPRGDTTFVLRYEAERGRRVWEKLPAGTDYAAARRMALEKELALHAPPTGFPGSTRKEKPAPTPGRTKIRDAADAYINALYTENNLVPKTIQGKKFELDRWIGWCAKEHVEELDRADLLAFRDRLRREGYAEWTVASNLMSVVTMLKHNPLREVVGLLKPADWPENEDTEPEPYEVEEVKALQSVATEEERLLIRFFVGTGCRDMEVAHLEWSDFNWAEKTVWIHAKPHLNNWKPKTRAGTRKIPISDSLVRDLKARRGEGLVFPAPRGGVDHHYLRTMQKLGERAGVPNVGLHRFRDSFITDMVRDGVDLLTLRKWVGHENLETLKLYAEALRAKDQRARDAANRQDRYALGAAAAD